MSCPQTACTSTPSVHYMVLRRLAGGLSVLPVCLPACRLTIYRYTATERTFFSPSSRVSVNATVKPRRLASDVRLISPSTAGFRYLVRDVVASPTPPLSQELRPPPGVLIHVGSWCTIVHSRSRAPSSCTSKLSIHFESATFCRSHDKHNLTVR